MDETAKVPAPDSAVSDPKRWVAAIVGAVLLGEALWVMLQILIRDWAMPALVNLLGQGPTQNKDAFEPQPLLVAFIEACLAAILLVLIMAWTRRRTRVLRVTIPRTSGVAQKAPSIAPPIPTSSSVPLDLPPLVRQSDIEQPVTTALPATPIASPTEMFWKPTSPYVPDVPAREAAKPAPEPQSMPPAPAPPTKPKKTKPVYYNIVGEPINDDE
jgi:hypothetical protein